MPDNENLRRGEKLPKLSMKGALDVLFWSFLYSQGDGSLHRKILNYLRRRYDLPNNFKRRYTRGKEPEGVLGSLVDVYRPDTFDLPEEEMERYLKFVQGPHRRNTAGNVGADRVKTTINAIIGEFVQPTTYNNIPTRELLRDIVASMAYKDHVNVVISKTRNNSFLFSYVLGSSKRPGPKVLHEMLDALRAVASDMTQEERASIIVYEKDSSQGEKSLETVLEEIRITLDSNKNSNLHNE
jgi:hypothetical protein